MTIARDPITPARRKCRDMLIRLAGLIALGCAGAALIWLYRLLHVVPHPRPTVGQYLLALIGFAGASLGTALTALGGHIDDPVELSDRWRPRL